MTFYAQLDRGDSAIDVMATAELDHDEHGRAEIVLGDVWLADSEPKGGFEVNEADAAYLRAVAAERFRTYAK